MTADLPWIDWLQLARYGVAVLFVISAPPALGWWVAVHPFVAFWRRLGAKASLWILGTGYAAVMVALFFVRDALLGRDLGFHPALAIAALPCFVVVGIVAQKRKKHLTWRILSGAPELSSDPTASKLLHEGIYARIRHPRYVEFIVGVLGWALLLGYVGVWLMALGGIVALHGIVLIEERELRQRFGAAWEAYAATVPRYLPRRHPSG